MPAEKRNIDVRRQDNSKLSKARVIIWFEGCISEEYTPPGYLLSLLIVVLLVQALTFRLGCYLITSFCLDDALVCPFLYSSQCGAVANSPASIPSPPEHTGCNLLSSCLQAFSGLAVCSRTGGGSATENEKTCSDDCFQTKHLQVEKELVRCLQAISVVALKIYKSSKPKWEGVP